MVQAPMVKAICGLDTLRHLRRLWLSDCKIESMGGLSACVSLQTLNLDNNRIRRIEGLEGLDTLEELWLNGNQLRSLAGLEALVNLRQLWAARNKLDHLGNCLDNNTALEELNLSDNRIGSFRELDNLARLPSLVNLALNDPHFGPNPVCNLCNYQTYVMFQLSQLQVLDSACVLDESKQLAEATFMKKRMYYNMRIKTLKRNTTNVIKQAQAIMQSRVGALSAVVADVEQRMKGIARELECAQFGVVTVAPTRRDAMQALEDKLDAVLKTKYLQIKELQVVRPVLCTRGCAPPSLTRVSSLDRQMRFRALKSHLLAVSDQHISRMMVELTTGGVCAPALRAAVWPRVTASLGAAREHPSGGRQAR